MVDTLDLAAHIGQMLRKKNMLLVTAESCTGGGVSHAVTEIAGSSEWFDCGFVTYSNEAKAALLGIAPELIATHGAVSEEVAAAMASGALSNSRGDVAISTTGIAGPGGAVPGKPVGTVCFGWSWHDQVRTERIIFDGDRQAVRQQTVVHALHRLLQLLEEHAC